MLPYLNIKKRFKVGRENDPFEVPSISRKTDPDLASYARDLIRHSRLPAGNALWVCQNFFFFFFFFFFFLFFRRQGFRMITFDRQAGPLQNLTGHISWS